MTETFPFTPGQDLGASRWHTVDQEMITGFGVSTRDPDPMHMDPDWAATESPYGKIIAFGFLTISLLSRFLYDALGQEPSREDAAAAAHGGHVMNYGFNRLRLVSPVPVGARIRGVFRTKACDADEKGNERVVIEAVVEIEGEDRPALVADWVVIYVPLEVSAKQAAAIS